MRNKIKKVSILFTFTIVMLYGFDYQVHAERTAHKYTNQQVTAYVSNADNKTASEISPYVHCVAVHPKNYYVNDWNNPIIPFGATIFTDADITIPYFNETTDWFVVQDTGQLNNEDNLSTYWFDIWCGTYWGSKTECDAYWDAVEFGTKVVSYNAWY